LDGSSWRGKIWKMESDSNQSKTNKPRQVAIRWDASARESGIIHMRVVKKFRYIWSERSSFV
jgi:hypothetical protein